MKLVLAVACLFAGPAALAGTPDWMKQVAQAPLPSYPDDTDAVLLLDERSTTVSAAGEVHTTYRKAYKILRPQGRKLGTVHVYFDTETQLTFLKAWSITADHQEYEVKEGDAVETSAFSESLYADTRYKLLQIPASQPGNIIGYEYQQKQRPSVLQAVWSFQQEIPVRRGRFVLELPANWGYSAHWRNHAVVEPHSIGENRWTWELADIDPVNSEPQMPALPSVAGLLGISFAATSPGLAGKSQASWAQVGRWYDELTSNRRDVTPHIRQKTRELLAGTDDPVEKARKLAFFVQHGIRYVAIEIGVGGFQPHSAQEVLAGGYGDCKDKVTLLSAMLREAGIDSYYVLINDDRDYVGPEFPTPLNFNHVILAIRLSKASDQADLFATLAHPKLGTLLLFDPTDSATLFGYLPPSLQSNYGLLVSEGDGELLKLPLQPATNNRLHRSATLTLNVAGELKGTVEEVRTGPAASALRKRLLDAPENRRQRVFQSLLSDLLDGAVLTQASVSGLKDFGRYLTITYGFTTRGYGQHAGDLFLFHSCALGRQGLDLLEGRTRKQPVAFSYAASETDVFDISFPADYLPDELPQAAGFEYPFASYKSESHVEQHALHYTRTFELRDVYVPLQRLDDLKVFFRKIADDERAFAILKASRGSATQ